MKKYLVFSFGIIFCLSLFSCSSNKSVGQFPSPMSEKVRSHERIEKKDLPGLTFKIKNVLSKPVEVYLPESDENKNELSLLIHFHGASYVAENAVYNSNESLMSATVNMGYGSSAYERPFKEKSIFTDLIQSIIDSVSSKKRGGFNLNKIYISSFSAGYGAVRAILKNHTSLIDGIILLDGLHTDYIPSGKVLAKGGKLNELKMKGFLDFAKMAVENEKKMLITHSEIFPGTYASTTETAEYLINSLGLKRDSVLKWGPGGMQQLSETNKNNLMILGFAGNTAPDHIDQLHGLPEFLKKLFEL